MFKRHSTLLLSLLCAAIAISAYFLAQRQPIFFLPSNSDLADSSRYAFLTESNRAAALVVDIRQNSTLGRLALPAIAEHSSIESSAATLSLSHQQQLFTQQLRDGKQQQRTLDSPITALASGKQQLAVRTQKQLSFYRLSDLSAITEIPLNSQNASLHYAALPAYWLAVENPPQLIIYEQNLKPIALPYQRVGAAALSPDNRFLAFDAQTATGETLAVIWSLENQAPLQEYPLNSPTLRPIIDNRSEHIYFLDRLGNGLQFTSRNFQQDPRRFHSLDQASAIALGFMETRLIIRNAEHFVIIDSNSLETLHSQKLTEAGTGIFISADSKTALLGGKQHLFTVKLHQGTLNSIPLPDAIEPSAIFMGASNTLCH